MQLIHLAGQISATHLDTLCRFDQKMEQGFKRFDEYRRTYFLCAKYSVDIAEMHVSTRIVQAYNRMEAFRRCS